MSGEEVCMISKRHFKMSRKLSVTWIIMTQVWMVWYDLVTMVTWCMSAFQCRYFFRYRTNVREWWGVKTEVWFSRSSLKSKLKCMNHSLFDDSLPFVDASFSYGFLIVCTVVTGLSGPRNLTKASIWALLRSLGPRVNEAPFPIGLVPRLELPGLPCYLLTLS